MARTPFIELGRGKRLTRLPILYEDRSVIAIDKPAGWMLVPFSWQRTSRNLQAAITSSIAARDFWAKSRNLKFLRHVHRLDGDTTGILLFAKSLGAVDTYGRLFESRKMEKTYLAVIHGVPEAAEWSCVAPLGPDPRQVGRMQTDTETGKEAETVFRLVASAGPWSLVQAHPYTGRTHQIRVHLLEAGYPVVGDDLYGPTVRSGPRGIPGHGSRFPLALRAVALDYLDPFQRRPVRIRAPVEPFLQAFGFKLDLRLEAVLGSTGPAPKPSTAANAGPSSGSGE